MNRILTAALLTACGAAPPPAPPPAPAPPTAPTAVAPPDCSKVPVWQANPPDMNAWVRASRAAGVELIPNLGGTWGAHQSQLGMPRLNLRPAGGGSPVPVVEVDDSLGGLVSLTVGDAANWPVAIESLDGERPQIGSPLSAPTVVAALASDVTGDGVAEGVFLLVASGVRAGPADEDAFLSTREMEVANAYSALVIVDARRAAVLTLPLFVSHQHRVSGTDGMNRQRSFMFQAALPPPLPWTQPVELAWSTVSSASDGLNRTQGRVVRGGLLRLVTSPYGARVERAEACHKDR